MSDPKQTCSKKQSFYQALTQLSSPRVRDLAWVIGSADLLSALQTRNGQGADWESQYQQNLKLCSFDSSKALEFSKPHLLQLDEDPSHLDLALEHYARHHKRVRLGVYYEHLTYFWLEHILKAKPMFREIQLYRYDNGVKQTLGALDIVATLSSTVLQELSEHTQEQALTIHFELASKFYLKVKPEAAHPPLDQSIPYRYYQYVGPNERDCFGGKLHRLYNHQLPLSQRAEAIADFQAKEIEVDARCLWLKGRIFRHISEWQTHAEHKALWLRQSEIASLYSVFNQGEPVLHAYPCSKPAWLAPPTMESLMNTNPMSEDKLLQEAKIVRGERGSTLWYVLSADQEHQTWLMIVPDDWGNRT